MSTPERFGPYEITAPIEEGGMAQVYRARHSTLGREVAIKVIRPDKSNSEEFIRRFEHEIRTIEALNHPNILRVIDHGKQGDTVYLVMEYMAGGTLADLIHRQGRLTPQQIDGLLRQIAAALSYAHEKRIVHRDLKPKNVLLNETGSAVLSDFGIAKVLGESTALTRAGMIIGSPPYMSPEQWRSETVDARADVYALGIMLYEMLTGTPPFIADTPLQMMHLHVYQRPPSVRRLLPQLPERVDWLLSKALAKNRAGRFNSAAELADAFAQAVRDLQDLPPLPMSRLMDDEPTRPMDNLQLITNLPTDMAVGPEQAEQQEADALRNLAEETRASRGTTRIINPLPDESRDHFVGREPEQAQLADLLLNRARLITVYGRTGVGKTALVCKVLADLAEAADGSAPDGMVLLNAVSTGISLDRVLLDFARLLPDSARDELMGVAQSGVVPPTHKITMLFNLLGEGRYVLLLDGLDALQQPESGAFTDPQIGTLIESVVRQGGPICVLATSTEPLPLPLELKPQERTIPLDQGLPTDDAIRLLRDSDPDNTAGLRDAPTHKLAQIAERLRGYPKALNAVVGRLLEDTLLSVDDLIAESRDGPAGEGLTRLIVQQAIERLPGNLIRILEALAVFERPVKQAALEFMLAPYTDTSTLRAMLNRLVRAFHVVFNRAVGTFGLHSVDREYCYTRIPVGQREDTPPRWSRYALHRRAADFYSRQHATPENWRNLDDIAPQLAEFEHLVQAELYNQAAELLNQFDAATLLKWGHYQRLIELHERLRGKIDDPQARMNSLNRLGAAYGELGDGPNAIASMEEALALARELQDRKREGQTLSNMGAMYQMIAQYNRSLLYLDQAVAVLKEINFDEGLMRARSNQGLALHMIGRIEEAREAYDESLQLARALQNRHSEAISAMNLCNVYRDLSDLPKAREFGELARVLSKEVGDPASEAVALVNLAQSASVAGDQLTALRHFEEAQALADSLGFERLQAYARMAVGTSALETGDLGRARRAIESALSFPPQPDFWPGVLLTQAIILMRMGEPEAARPILEESIRQADALITEMPTREMRYVRAIALGGLAVLGAGRLEPAIEAACDARRSFIAPGLISEMSGFINALMLYPGADMLAPLRAALVEGEGC